MPTVLEQEDRPRKWLRRLLAGTAVLLGVLAALLVLIAVLASGIINTDAMRDEIERTVSNELGGTVTFERLRLVLLPRPEIRFLNLAIDVPGAASASVASAGVYARLFPLLRGRFEISSVTLDRPVIALSLPSAPEGGGDRARRKMKPAGRSAGAVLAVAGRTMPDLSLEISHGGLSLLREGQTVLSFGNLAAELAFVSDKTAPEELPAGTPSDYFHITGSARTVLDGAAALPGPVTISIGRFDARTKELTVQNSRTRLLDMDMTVSGSIRDYLSGAPDLNLLLNGAIGLDGADWLRDLAGLTPAWTFRTPLMVKDVRLRTSGRGTAARVSLAGSVTQRDGAAVSFALQQQPDLLAIERLEVKDHDSEAVLRLATGPQGLDLAFTGVLTGATISRMVDREQQPFRWIAGDLSAHLPRDRWTEATAEGTLEGAGVMIASQLTGSFAIDRFSAQSHGRAIDFRPLVLSLGPDILTAQGTVSLSSTGVAADLDISSDRIDIASLRELLNGKRREIASTAAPPAEKRLTLEGELRLYAGVVTFPSYTAEAVSMTLSMAQGRTAADLEEATLCGIGLTGALRTAGHEVELRLEPRVRSGAVNESLRCVMREDLGISGTYDLSGLFTSRGSWETLLPSLQGDFDLTAKQGRIQSDRVVTGVLAYLNSTSLLKGSHSELAREGVPYETFTLRGSVRDGMIRLQQGMIKSKELHIAADGDIDLRRGTLALTVLAAPFTSMDRLLGSIPVLKQIAGNALIVVPVAIEGTFRAPKVRALPVSGVGTNITNLMKNIVQAPVKIVDPVLPRDRERGPETRPGQP